MYRAAVIGPLRMLRRARMAEMRKLHRGAQAPNEWQLWAGRVAYGRILGFRRRREI